MTDWNEKDHRDAQYTAMLCAVHEMQDRISDLYEVVHRHYEAGTEGGSWSEADSAKMREEKRAALEGRIVALLARVSRQRG